MTHNFHIEYTREDGSYGSCMGNANLDNLFRRIEEDVKYYLDLGYIITNVFYRETCTTCKGEGMVNRRKNARLTYGGKTCNVCGGIGHNGEISVDKDSWIFM